MEERVGERRASASTSIVCLRDQAALSPTLSRSYVAGEGENIAEGSGCARYNFRIKAFARQIHMRSRFRWNAGA